MGDIIIAAVQLAILVIGAAIGWGKLRAERAKITAEAVQLQDQRKKLHAETQQIIIDDLQEHRKTLIEEFARREGEVRSETARREGEMKAHMRQLHHRLSVVESEQAMLDDFFLWLRGYVMGSLPAELQSPIFTKLDDLERERQKNRARTLAVSPLDSTEDSHVQPLERRAARPAPARPADSGTTADWHRDMGGSG